MVISRRSLTEALERIRRLMGGAPAHVQAAALPWRETDKGLEIMLITSRDTGRWVLPKGWPERDERPCDAAGREAVEEAGLRGIIAEVATGRYYYGKCLKSGLEKRCEVLVFPLKVERIEDKWPEKGQRKRRWVRPTEAAIMVREPDLAELLGGFTAH